MLAGMEDSSTPTAGKRLSQSGIWDMQRRYYESQGPRAWSQGKVPSHLTCNAYMARAYAQLILAWLRDCQQPGVPKAFAIDSTQPLDIIELGAGSGYFASLLLKTLRPLLAELPGPTPRLRYVLTDIARSNVAAWRAHPAFAELQQEGVLDCACFDAERDPQLRLAVSRQLLGGDGDGRPANPPIVLANYVFDSLRVDIFRTREGILEAGLLDLEPGSIQTLAQGEEGQELIYPEVDYQPVARAAYDEARWNDLLEGYRQRLGDTVFNFPSGGLACLARLRQLCGGRFLLLAADKGYTHEHQLVGNAQAGMAWHRGCFSMMVNFHALGAWTQAEGGLALGSGGDGQLELEALCLGAGADSFPRLRAAFAQLRDCGPLDVFRILDGALRNLEAFDLNAVLGLARLAAFDPYTFHRLHDRLYQLLPGASQAELRQLRRVLRKVEALFFPYSARQDVLFALGRLMAAMRRHSEALELFRRSLDVYGEHPLTLFNLAINLYRLGQLPQALQALDRALLLDPEHSPARDWRLLIAGEME